MKNLDSLLTKAILKAIIELGNSNEEAYEIAVKLIKDPNLNSEVFTQHPELKEYLSRLLKDPRFKKALVKSISLVTVVKLAIGAVLVAGILNTIIVFISTRITGISPIGITDLKNLKQRLTVCITHGLPKALVSTTTLQLLRKEASKVIREVLEKAGLEELIPDVEAKIIGTWRQVFTFFSRSISDVAKYNEMVKKIIEYVFKLAGNDSNLLNGLSAFNNETSEAIHVVRNNLKSSDNMKALQNFNKEIAKIYTTVTLKAKLPTLILKFAFAILDKLFTKYSDKISKRTNLDPDLLNFLYDLIRQVAIKCA